MDSVDVKILEILTEDVRTPIKVIADKVYLSQASVSARIAAMRSAGIIRPSHVSIDPAALGYQFRCFVDVQVPLKRRTEFEAFCNESHHVIEASYITGSYTVFLKAAFCHTDEMSAFLRKLNSFGETQTRVAVGTIVPSRGVRIPSNLKTEEESLSPP